ncbi:MAG: NAD(P)-binding domain-containing protein [Scytonematopsis contorta HA4267-MV1]|jgi:cation diffusion facilitator CzcD-associated flavoprotein CzcO|nr:NAD(P)-binding domain-containing protein [Scytonematopsis contorta HA4267-MV1]
MLVQRVCIIGAGISGLVTAKTFVEEGYEVLVYEKQHALGGVWEKSRRYPNVRTQTPGRMYSYPDYPLPDSYPEWPSGEQVNAYLESYANHFELLKRIQFNTEVIALKAIDNGHKGWEVTTRIFDGIVIETSCFDFVAICNGVNHIPNIPAIPGIDEFKLNGGTVLHTTEVGSTAQIEGKDVVVVGFGKSACDIAMLAVENALSCHIVFREADWKAPRFFFGFINIKHLFLTRFAESMTPKYNPNKIEKWLHSHGKLLIDVFWKLQENIMCYTFGLDVCGLVPKKPLIKAIVAKLNIAPKNFYKYIRNHKIIPHQTSITRFVEDGIELASGEKLNPHLVVFGTGFKQAIPFLEEKYRYLCLDNEGYFHLYRNLIHPEIPNLAFVGYNAGLSATLTGDIGALWLVQFLKGNIKKPATHQMIAEMEADLEWRKQNGYAGYGGTCFFSSTFHYLDTLMYDMGLPVRQIGSIAAVMQPLNSQAYSNVRTQLKNLYSSKVQDLTNKLQLQFNDYSNSR